MGGGKSPEFATLPPFATPANQTFESGGGKVAKWQTKIEDGEREVLLFLFATLPLCHLDANGVVARARDIPIPLLYIDF